MSIVTLTSDFKKNDYYIGAVNGIIKSQHLNTEIIEITNTISPHNIKEAAFVLKHCFRFYPENSIHIILVDAEISSHNKPLVIKYQKRYFIGTQNVLQLLAEEMPDEVYQIKPEQNNAEPDTNYLYLARASNEIISGNINNIGAPFHDFRPFRMPEPAYEDTYISAQVTYIDSYGNAFTNIRKELFYSLLKNNDFEITIKSMQNKIAVINNQYSDSISGELLAIFNSIGILEIAMNKGSVAQILNLSVNDPVRVKFINKKNNELKLF